MENEQRLYTKEEVVDLMKRRVERSHRAFFDRYGVKNLQELDNLFESVKVKYEKIEEDKGPKTFDQIVGLKKVQESLHSVLQLLAYSFRPACEYHNQRIERFLKPHKNI